MKIHQIMPAVVVAATALAANISAAKADVYAYESTGADNFGQLDLTTGAFTQLGNSGLLLSGLGSFGGTIYGGAEGSTTLYSVNQTNGSLTTIGTSSVAYEDTGSTTSGLYEFGKDDNLYSVDPSTAATTLIGNLGVPISGIIGMSSGGSNLYITNNSSLYLVNTATGGTTLIGDTTGTFGAMVSIDGTYYGGGEFPLQVYTFDPANAVGTPGALETGVDGDFWGLASPTGVPEPATWAMFLVGFGAVGFAMRRPLRKVVVPFA